MKKIFIVIFIILCGYVYGNEYEILEENGVLFFKYSKDELLSEIKDVLEENRGILSKDFNMKGGERKDIKAIIDGKEYIEKDKYYLCEIEEKIEKCLLYREGKRIFYNESFFSEKKFLKYLSYESSGKMVTFLIIDGGPSMWFKNNKLERYRITVRNEEKKYSGSITYIFNKKENLEKIEVSNPLGIKSTLYGEEVKEYTSSIGNENYYFDPEGKFIEKKMYYKYK